MIIQGKTNFLPKSLTLGGWWVGIKKWVARRGVDYQILLFIRIMRKHEFGNANADYFKFGIRQTVVQYLFTRNG